MPKAYIIAVEQYHTEGISPVPKGTDIIEKENFCLVDKNSLFRGMDADIGAISKTA